MAREALRGKWAVAVLAGFLCAFTFGIGNLWLIPYSEAATAAFYREISGNGKVM